MLDKVKLQDLIINPEKISKLKFDDISKILSKAKSLFENENLLLEVSLEENEEAFVIGDIHGNLISLIKLYDVIKKHKPKIVIFLGDIVDRGPKQFECLIFVLMLKIFEPNKYFILAGNHETIEMNQTYGFYYEFSRRFEDSEKFKEILAVYDVIPICAIVDKIILCLHGGIPEDIEILKKLKGLKPNKINNSILTSIESGIFQIMWNDPKSELNGFMSSFRGPGIKFFGKEIFVKFMDENNLKYLIRSHECFPEGYKWFFNNRLLSIFSSANYRGELLPNPASYAIIKNKEIFPKILKIL